MLVTYFVTVSEVTWEDRLVVKETNSVWCGCGEGSADEGWTNIDVAFVDSWGKVTEGEDDGSNDIDVNDAVGDEDGDTALGDDPTWGAATVLDFNEWVSPPWRLSEPQSSKNKINY